MMTAMVVACLKWTAQEPDADLADVRVAGVSAADQAALETALVIGAAWGLDVVVVTVGPPAAEHALREALACGAVAAVRVDAPGVELESFDVARELAAIVAGAAMVICGDYSSDRGSGSVPAFLAHHLGAAQALGLVSVEPARLDGDVLRVVRRLDGGRREILRVPVPCVLSVEGSVADLRRASVRATLASRTAAVEVRPRTTSAVALQPTMVTPYRPRARVLPPPQGDDVLTRLRALTDAGGAASAHGERLTLEPHDAARRILAALREWGELDEPDR